MQVILCVSRSRYCAVMFQTFKTRFKSYLMYFLWPILDKLLGFSAFLVVDTLTSISCHLRAIGGRLNARFQLQEHSMLRKCYVSKRNGIEG